MKKTILAITLLCSALLILPVHAKDTNAIRYGHNDAAANSVTVNNTKIYYESYGKGKDLLVLHPNGGDIASMAEVIKEFAKDHRVIAIDSRSHGQSGAGSTRLTYDQMAEDTAAVMDQAGVKQAEVIGWSDGGIVALILASKHPEKVSKMVVMGANTTPEGANQWAIDMIKDIDTAVAKVVAKTPANQEANIMHQHLQLMLQEPHISNADLAKITAETLVMAGDRDIIKTSHTVDMFEHIPKANLMIVPASTHFIIEKNPQQFNRIAREFLSTPFSMQSSEDAMKQ